jgi:hypothetical protein
MAKSIRSASGLPPEQPSDDRLVLALHRSDDRQIPLGPHDSCVELGVHEHRKLVVEAVGKIDSGLEWCHLILCLLGDDDVAQNKGAARAQSGCDTGKEIGLACRWEVMNGERGDDEIEATFRQRIFKPSDPHVNAILR